MRVHAGITVTLCSFSSFRSRTDRIGLINHGLITLIRGLITFWLCTVHVLIMDWSRSDHVVALNWPWNDPWP